MTCIVCNGVLIEDFGKVVRNAHSSIELGREPSTWHCDDCGLVYKHVPKGKTK